MQKQVIQIIYIKIKIDLHQLFLFDIYIYIYYIFLYIYIYINIYIYIYIYIYINRRPLKSIQTLIDLSDHDFNLIQLLQFHLLFRVRFHFDYCLRRSPRQFNRGFVQVITRVERNKQRDIVFTGERLSEEAIESWPKQDLSPRPLKSVLTY